MRTYKINADIFRKGTYVPILKQGDDTTLLLYLYSRGVSYSIPAGCTFTLNALLSNDTAVIQETDMVYVVDSNLITCTLDSRIVAVSGVLSIELKITDVNNIVTSTFIIEAEVEPTLLSNATVDNAVHDIIIDTIALASKAPYVDLLTGEWYEFSPETGLFVSNGYNANSRSIISVERTNGNGNPGTIDTFTITFSDETTSTFNVYHGANGLDGNTPVKSLDYFDGIDGVSAYFHIKWGTTATPAQLLTTPNEYIGVCSSSSATPPANYTGYVWYKYKGEIGANGVSAYVSAQTGGYTDTEATFYLDLAAVQGLAAILAGI